ncbi:sensor histidine kinase [Ostreiculturibacter nitratireducens]|uniref:GAF domain-containing sensor histidine kinase n=1 Tax=Ostreiculturibacter nitratireducens TaxID=3075226 RepID=UPI0031B632D6
MTTEPPTGNEWDYYLRISSHLAGQVEIRAALRSVKAEIENILPLDHLDVCLMDDDEIWNTSYEVGLRTRWSRSRSLVAMSPVRDVLLGKSDYMLTGNAMEDPRYTFPGALSQPILKHKLRSRVNVAMKVLGRTIGSLNCSSRTADLYDDTTVERVRHVADVLAPYFYALRAAEKARGAAIVRAEAQAREEGLRLGALQLTQALEQERQRIGMDLHDQTLADLTRLMRDISRSDEDMDREMILSRLQDCIQDLRRIIDTAVPTLLEMFGFVHAVRIHLERAVGDEGNVSIAVIDETENAPDRLDATTRIALFRIVQEAINNAANHSGADRIVVRIENDEGLLVSISDNGTGISPRDSSGSGRKTTGGLTHMRTRARLIAADFRIVEKDGTRIEIRPSEAVPSAAPPSRKRSGDRMTG